MISLITGLVTLAYLGAGLWFVGASLWSSPRLQVLGRFFLWSGWGAHTGVFLGRWWESYHLAAQHSPGMGFSEALRLVILQVPLSNFYESLVFFSWCLPAVGLFFFRRQVQSVLWALISLLACLLLAYASLGVDSSIKPLMPALKSNWLLIHVLTCFFGYAAFALAFGAGILYLWQRRTKPAAGSSLPLMDSLIYQATVIGFIFLTLGILTGAVWAETAWGRYWSWDPKETWSLITWLIYATLLHARLVKGWQGPRIAWLAVFGFMAVLFTYLGVSFLLPGLHSYLT
jgi:cytochrome c-type biogenesis protein CcsB